MENYKIMCLIFTLTFNMSGIFPNIDDSVKSFIALQRVVRCDFLEILVLCQQIILCGEV